MSGTILPGNKNSSITRVRPILGELLRRDATGSSWLPGLMDLAGPRSDGAAVIATTSGALLPRVTEVRSYKDRVLAEHYGVGTIDLPQAFEWDCAPPEAFLRWLITSGQLSWPKAKPGVDRKFSPDTERLRRTLYEGTDPTLRDAVRNTALTELSARGAAGSFKAWWAFEGFTSVDCCLETDRLLLLIEGKRTEGFSAATDWYPARHQIGRNLEVAREHAKGRDYAVMVLAEEPVTVSDKELDASWPHLDAAVRQEMKARYLGCATWEAVCSATGLDWEQYRNLTSGDVARQYREAR